MTSLMKDGLETGRRLMLKVSLDALGRSKCAIGQFQCRLGCNCKRALHDTAARVKLTGMPSGQSCKTQQIDALESGLVAGGQPGKRVENVTHIILEPFFAPVFVTFGDRLHLKVTLQLLDCVCARFSGSYPPHRTSLHQLSGSVAFIIDCYGNKAHGCDGSSTLASAGGRRPANCGVQPYERIPAIAATNLVKDMPEKHLSFAAGRDAFDRGGLYIRRDLGNLLIHLIVLGFVGMPLRRQWDIPISHVVAQGPQDSCAGLAWSNHMAQFVP